MVSSRVPYAGAKEPDCEVLPMRAALARIVSTLLVLCLAATAARAGSSAVTRSGSSPASSPPAVSFKATPVQRAHADGVDLAYREFGAGEPLLMVAGFGATMNDWNPIFIGILATRYHVYVYDHRGMGSSGDGGGSPSISRYARDAALLMKELGHESMHVYGVSMGLSISQQLVIDHPDRVRKLVLDSNAYSVRIPETKKLLKAIEAVSSNASLPEGVRREARANLAWKGTWDQLAGIRKDVMLVVGTGDELTPDSVSARMAAQIPGAWLVRFKKLPHVGSHYAPEEYGQNALTFLRINVSPTKR